MSVNSLLIETLMKFHHYLGDCFKIEVPCADNCKMTLQEVFCLLIDRVTGVFRREKTAIFRHFHLIAPIKMTHYWQDFLLFSEYYHGETGQGLVHRTRMAGPDGWQICC